MKHIYWDRVNSEQGTDITWNITHHPEEYIMPLFAMCAGFTLCIKIHKASILTGLGERLQHMKFMMYTVQVFMLIVEKHLQFAIPGEK